MITNPIIIKKTIVSNTVCSHCPKLVGSNHDNRSVILKGCVNLLKDLGNIVEYFNILGSLV